ncbi:methionine--tRNA ligase [Pasteuria penetrans]|uniref:methionine--tRNA ligase n=1 Tax=Pasteuria penetrans TaxID=86005 RepID=UPI000FA9073B|nr:methionine--tRNA ligase [Pasteuria penetrans]
MGGKGTYYITTPVYYPNAQLHIGHAYTTIAGDVLARFKRAQGYDVFYLTGTDEHGQKIAKQAATVGEDPQIFVDEMVRGIQSTWEMLDIQYDDFIRTTQERHRNVVQEVFAYLKEKGDIYLGVYEGRYCIYCESFFPDRSGLEGRCPDCHRPGELIREPSYFFRLKRYEDRLRDYYRENPDFLQPRSRRNEVVANFLNPGLTDISISRIALSWGVPVPDDPKHVVYVWLDALFNYLSVLGYRVGGSREAGRMRYWPADVQLVGKDIARFHGVYWPIFLMALDFPLPRRVFAHGFFEVAGEKMSKSKGNVVRPRALVRRYGCDSLRYYLLREVPFGDDGVFSPQRFLMRINTDLVNDFSNLCHRTITMVDRYCEGCSPDAPEQTEGPLRREADRVTKAVEVSLDSLQFSVALVSIWDLIKAANRFIEVQQPWNQVKTGGRDLVAGTLWFLLAVLRRLSLLIQPFLPGTARKIRQRLGLTEVASWEESDQFVAPPVGTKLLCVEPLFLRLSLQEESEYLVQNLSQDG